MPVRKKKPAPKKKSTGGIAGYIKKRDADPAVRTKMRLVEELKKKLEKAKKELAKAREVSAKKLKAKR